MTETQNTPTSELDFDAWLAGGERTTHHVTLFGRLDLLADIEELEKQRVTYTPPAEEDASLGGETDPNADIEAQIEALEAQLYASKREFRVSAITEEEYEAIKDEVRKNFSKEIDEASAKGRAEARKTAARMGITSANDINGIVRVGANEEANKIMSIEVLWRKIAFSTKTRFNGVWRDLNADQVKVMHTKLGDAQINMLSEAALSASNDVPEVTVPKS